MVWKASIRKDSWMIVRVNMRQLMRVAEWTERNRRHVMSTIRELADSEENYLIIARELERVKANNIRARSLRAEASLTLIEWLSIVDAYQWKCAYCKEKPFKVMHHIVPFPEGGNSRSNCLPSCRSCHNRSQKKASAQPPQII